MQRGNEPWDAAPRRVTSSAAGARPRLRRLRLCPQQGRRRRAAAPAAHAAVPQRRAAVARALQTDAPALPPRPWRPGPQLPGAVATSAEVASVAFKDQRTSLRAQPEWLRLEQLRAPAQRVAAAERLL